MSEFIAACDGGDAATVRRLLQAGADPNEVDQGFPAIAGAAQYGHVNVVRVLVEAGAKLEATSPNGVTALMYAAMYGKADCAEALLEWGADKDAADEYGDTALHRAAINGKLECARLLRRHGANLEAKNKRGDTALVQAAYYGKADCAAALLEWGADKDVAPGGWTALHNAARNGHLECARLLVAAKVDRARKTEGGKTALQIARRHLGPKAEVVKLLKQADANAIASKTSTVNGALATLLLLRGCARRVDGPAADRHHVRESPGEVAGAGRYW